MHSPHLKKLHRLADEFLTATENNDSKKIEELRAEEEELANALTPREKYKYVATLIATMMGTTFKQLDAEVIDLCKSNTIAVKYQYLEDWTKKLEDAQAAMAAKQDQKIKDALGSPLLCPAPSGLQ